MRMIAALPYVFSPSAVGAPTAVATTGPAAPGPAADGGFSRIRAGLRDDARLIWLLVVGTLPAIVAGLLFNKVIEARMRTPEVAIVALAIGGALFFVAERTGTHERSDRTLTFGEAFLIGCAQAVALIPGVSRSGATLTVALFVGLRRPEAARFVFLLAIPAIVAAAGKEAPKLLEAGMGGDAMLFAIGVVMSAIVGYIAVRGLIDFLQRHRLDLFGWYRLALAATAAAWLLAR
jgi:undecaprenyl-diphosphatase